MADAERPTKRQRLNAEYSNAELDNMCCSICTEPFVDPVSLRGSGHTYCRACITQALANQRRCPLSNARITIPRRGGVDGVLDPNHQVRSMMDAQRVACTHASRGCTERPKLGDVEAHEASCAFAPKKCSRCPFLGSRAETEEHMRSCPYVVLGPVLDAQANRIQSLERRVTEQDRTNEQLAARLDALERSARTVTPASARRPQRKASELVFAKTRNDVELSMGGKMASCNAGTGCAISSETLLSGTHSWEIRLTRTDVIVGIGVCTESDGFCLDLYGKAWYCGVMNSCLAQKNEVAEAEVPWRDGLKDGSVLVVSYDCDTGLLSVGLPCSEAGLVRGQISYELDEWASKSVSPFVFLTGGNICEIAPCSPSLARAAAADSGPRIQRPPRDVENASLTFDPSRCENSIDLSEGGTLAKRLGRAIASSSFDSGVHAWRLYFTETDRYIGVGVCTGDMCFALSLAGPNSGTWHRVANGDTWYSGRGVAEANVPWIEDFKDGSTLNITYHCEFGELIVDHEGSPGFVRRTFPELASKRVSPLVFLTHGNTCKISGGGAVVPRRPGRARSPAPHRGLDRWDEPLDSDEEVAMRAQRSRPPIRRAPIRRAAPPPPSSSSSSDDEPLSTWPGR